ncbi:UDP-N-acetylmuramoyl-tripeptide--D-alanyl-D-alanine ligase [Candidatus Planktophila limnetica]|uniref:UDP-N-acetylmuramoyl-tripeptide--D-alanyl-D-alanine ligase n=1 Tax=Candidatus Planktophila limnetica TaxID=573600 RepID=A0A249LG13_9ACTN|nr:UDP-N-acetylmuramoyl-tripeptide--D-alanyl-D-alanine ligase [Candidatus Planktophila limnetica]ASY27825.1 UDP-N-acetylmuramoyl-tripeptide--D-alanyl-D-alanine ligase [Candidatus Planktophila limnetica]
MIALTLEQIAKIVGGKTFGDSSKVISAAPVFDSREVSKGSLFLALVGQSSDGHSFTDDAQSRGATGCLTTREVPGNGVVVSDVLIAVRALASYVRKQLPELKVIAITGSSGKTTTKDLLASILSSRAECVWTKASFNNELGAPITLLACDEQTKYCILEMGARHQGDIAALCEMAKPNVGVVLRVGTAHLGEFGSVEKIAQTKSELIAGLGPDAVAVLGTYDPYTKAMNSLHSGRVIYFGQGSRDDVRAADVEMREARPHFDLVTPDGRDAVGMRLIGAHQISNALAAAAVCTALEISIEVIASGLSTADLASKWRMQVSDVEDLLIINDSYNANPESMNAALDSLVLFTQESGGSSWAFLGQMHELGSESNALHASVAAHAHELGIDHLVSIGTRAFAEGIPAHSATTLHYCDDISQALSLVSHCEPGDAVLVKASRSEHFETLSQGIEDLWKEKRGEDKK